MFNNVWHKLSANKEYRSAFAKAQFKRLVPFQIRALRKNRHMSQEELAEKANLTQGVISRAEDSDYGNLTSNTILKIADGFDCAFVGRFVPFSELDEWFVDLSEDKVQVPSFEEENQRFVTGRLRRRRVSRRRMFRPVKKVRAVYIDTRKGVISPRPTAGGTQLSLPLLDSAKGLETAFYFEGIRTPSGSTLANLIQSAPPKALQAGGI